ncbi:hypothetical protein TH53_17050 [Pedobacter lusitanus]|uniref:Uncharacterized protein n=1 Tax=Pedobacter lusitanus TaxID=1503925 RepID=A0A0D0GFE9_9SPHI|nr:hypothetical protein TH53_17050 [Pedobacter lusitanus]
MMLNFYDQIIGIEASKPVYFYKEKPIERTLNRHWKGVGRTTVLATSFQGPSNPLPTSFQ